MSDFTPDFARVAGEQFLKNISQQAYIFLETVSAHSNFFLDTVSAHEQYMLSALTKEKENNSALKSLAGSIAHEMRNPLAQLHGMLYLLEEQIPYLNNNSYIQDAYKVIQNGFQVIDITMDAINDKPIDRESFVVLSALDLVEEAVKDYAYEEAAHAEKVSVKGGDFKLMAEPVMVKYVLYNLIQNALWYVKSLPDAEILISVMPNVDGVNQIEVRDTGPGIAADIIPKLFDPFYTSDKQGGTGLGLSYCKRTMSALGGDISCHSALGQYTAFVLSFPTLSAEKI
jgi:signal transduction histidine kinase